MQHNAHVISWCFWRWSRLPYFRPCVVAVMTS